MMDRLLSRLKLRNSIDLCLRSLMSRPWYLLAHAILLTLCMSSFYIMSKLIFIIPPRDLRAFEFFRRGGLEASTDLLIFASIALLLCLLLIAVLTLRMQIRLSWRANQEHYLTLVEIGMSRAELKHVLRLEGLILLLAGLVPSLLISRLLLGFLANRWDLDQLNIALSAPNLSALVISLFICIILLEWSHANLVHTLDPKIFRDPSRKPPLYRRFRRKSTNQVQIWFEIKNYAWRISLTNVLADILTLSISFAVIFFIYATKAGINRPQVDRVANEVAYDLLLEGSSLGDLKVEVERLTGNLPDALQGKIEVIYLKQDPLLAFDVQTDQVKSHFRDLLEKTNAWTGTDHDEAPVSLNFNIFPISRLSYDEIFGTEQSDVVSTSVAPEKKHTSALSYDEWLEQSGALLLAEIDFAERGRILTDRFKALETEAGQHLAFSRPHERLKQVYISELIEDYLWYMDPVTEHLAPSLIVPEETYHFLFHQDQDSAWQARLRVDENSLISFHSLVKRDWTWRQTDIRVIDHYGRRAEQLRIHRSLDILFDLSLFFIIQFVLIQLIAFTQGQYFVREHELKLLREIGLDRKQERSIIRYHCLQIFVISLITSYCLAYVVSSLWNRLLRPITAVGLSWPILALVCFSLGLALAVFGLSHFRFKKNPRP